MGFLSKNKIKKYQEKGYDLDFLSKVQPKGNIDFRTDRYYYSGSGYSTVLHVYGYPTNGLMNFWLQDLMLIDGTRAFLSVYQEDNRHIKKKLESSIGEKQSRISGKAKATQNQQELDEIRDMAELYREISRQNITILGIYVRIFVSASTVEKLFKKVEEIKDKASNFKMTILVGELDYEYKAPFIPPSKQIELPNRRRGTIIKAYDLAGGYFFDHTKLEDQHGSYYGYTRTNGAINFNFLERDNRRTRSFMFISGNPNMGQTTFSLKVNDDLYSKGHYIRNFDASGKFSQQTRQQSGLILDLSGGQNRINPFQIFPTVTAANGIEVDEMRSFELHVEKLKNIFKMLNNQATGDDMKVFENVLTDFYISKGIWFRNPTVHVNDLRATQISKEEYPVLSDFVNYLYDTERRLTMRRTVSPYLLASISRIKQTFDTMLQTQAAIFEGITEFQDISKEKVVTFDFSGLKGQPSIFNAQVFSVLSLVSADVTNNGKRCKQIMLQNPQIQEADLPHYVVNIADAQNLITPKYQTSVDLLADIMDGMGENFAGVIISVHSLQGILFEKGANNYSADYATAVKRIFGLMQYRVFAQTNETDLPLLAEALAGSMSRSELETLVNLEKGDLFMNIASVGNVVFHQELMDNEVSRYGGIR
ncbi:virulence factor [Ligilactobacillus salivarius]|uniref:virulence factor n=1 Tax=Ligilactobacillus salivarius TaxID=1624 RepID=UPI00364F9070